MPALRERTSDIPLLAMFFAQKFAKKMAKHITHVGEDVMRRLTVSFNLDNVVPRLTELLAHPEKADKIRLAGLRAFRSGYDYARTAKQLEEYLS